MHAPPPRASRCLSHVADATEGARLNCEGAWFAQAAQLVWVMLSLRLRRWPVAYLSGRDLAWLERRRAELFGLMAQVGDFRRGALNAVWRKCGKPNCACAQPGHRGARAAAQPDPPHRREDGECAPEAGAGAGESAAG